MEIKIGDKVAIKNRSPLGRVLGREGVITSISLGLRKSDPAGELGVNVKEYDTEMNYSGSISYETDSGDNYWAYFNQIEKVAP